MRAARLSGRAALLASFLTAATGAAQERDTHDPQIWINVVATGGVNERLLYHLEIQPRIGDGMSRLDQLMLRGALGMKLSDRLSVYQGYARVRTPRSGRSDTLENRSYQQLSWKLSGRLSTRTRLEQRWLSSGRDTGWRVREMVRLAVPVPRLSGVAVLGHAEGFFALNDTDWGARSGFDRLRSFIGAEVPIGGKSTVEIGYMNQWINQANRSDTMDHIASINLFLRP